jgi:hypothetical protein
MKEKKEKLYSTGRVIETRKLTISDRQLTIVQTLSPTNSIIFLIECELLAGILFDGNALVQAEVLSRLEFFKYLSLRSMADPQLWTRNLTYYQQYLQHRSFGVMSKR